MKNKFNQIVSRMVCLGLLFASFSLYAVDGTWTTDGSDIWSNIANWNSGAGPIADGVDSTATFANTITAARTVTLDRPAPSAI